MTSRWKIYENWKSHYIHILIVFKILLINLIWTLIFSSLTFFSQSFFSTFWSSFKRNSKQLLWHDKLKKLVDDLKSAICMKNYDFKKYLLENSWKFKDLCKVILHSSNLSSNEFNSYNAMNSCFVKSLSNECWCDELTFKILNQKKSFKTYFKEINDDVIFLICWRYFLNHEFSSSHFVNNLAFIKLWITSLSQIHATNILYLYSIWISMIDSTFILM